MPNYAVIENDKVVNMCVASAEDVKPNNWVLCEDGGIGFDYINGQFIDNRPKAVVELPKPVPTKEELLAKLQVIQAQIQELG